MDPDSEIITATVKGAGNGGDAAAAAELIGDPLDGTATDTAGAAEIDTTTTTTTTTRVVDGEVDPHPGVFPASIDG